ncbi:hypothetical protein Tsubulata_048843 [Turnera subulata]|uniref:Protein DETOXIFICATION n=1 Tax=Turnera subulata TaxID=218843 RepID=A0A9Q0F8J0_9ROSI|nr:hypothetical protein Tsubulata_048843 [Turnera subulata]
MEGNARQPLKTIKLWYLAGPAIFTSVCQYSLGAVTQVFAGHVGTLQLAAVSVENSVIAGFSFGAMLGMGSALETLCGQAYGAGQLDMLGIYMQRSWVILLTTATFLSLIYIFAAPILQLIGQTATISKAAGVFAIWMLPQLFSYALIFPMQKFLQAQSKIMVMALIAAVSLVLHTVFSWLLMLKLGWGLLRGLVLYGINPLCRISEGCRGFGGCVVYLHEHIGLDSHGGIGVRISNELGAAHPRTAKFSLLVAIITSFIMGLLLSTILLVYRDTYPSLFSSDSAVKELVKQLTPLLALCIVINNVQPVLSGVAVGAGWQAAVAYVNIGCYYLFGIPLGLILGYKLDMGVSGIWSGMLSGTVLQTCVLSWMIYRTNWNKEASVAGDRIKEWGGHTDSKEDNNARTT